MRPRDYAQEIMSLSDNEEKKKVFERVPDEWKALVKTHCENIRVKRRIAAGLPVHG